MAVVRYDSHEEVPADLQQFAKRNRWGSFDVHVVAEAKHNETVSKLGALVTESRVYWAVLSIDDIDVEKISDALDIGLKIFRADENGQVVAYEGGKVIYGPDLDPMTPEDWAPTLRQDAPELFCVATNA